MCKNVEAFRYLKSFNWDTDAYFPRVGMIIYGPLEMSANYFSWNSLIQHLFSLVKNSSVHSDLFQCMSF